ncbi:MAG TPA: hypothetical protein VNV44_03260 [Solirubrobacteraceae bacterium]|jgi:hypothetical protein|nr:hypothetical protein [Solirubrobacteraceae bacterium]
MQDVDDVLAHSQELLDALHPVYDQSLTAQDAGHKLKPKIKAILGEQRTALDYLATGVYSAYGDGSATGPQVRYPFAKSEKGFDRAIDKTMPGVRAGRPDVARAIGRYQRYRPGQEWLKWLNGLRTQSAHARLIPLVPELGERYEFTGGLIVIAPSGATFAHPILGESASIEQLVGVEATYRRSLYLGWRFTDPDRPVLQTLREIQDGVRVASGDVCRVAGL